MLTSSSSLRKNKSFQLVERTMKFCINGKCTCNLKPAKILFFIVKYANLWRACRYHRSGCLSSLTQPRRRPQQERHKYTYLSTKNNRFSPFASEFFLFLHFADILVLSTTWNDLFRSCVDYVSVWWWQMFNFVLLSQKLWIQFISRIVRTHFASVMTLNNCEIIAETQKVTFSDEFLAVVDVVFA